MKKLIVLVILTVMITPVMMACKCVTLPNESEMLTTEFAATAPPATEPITPEPPSTDHGTVLNIDELREINNMTAEEVEAKYGARQYEYTMNGGTPVYSIESLPGVFLVYSGYGSINDGYEPIVGSASGIILTDGYAQNIHGVYIGMDLSSAGIEWDAVNLSLNSGLSLVKTFEDLGITVGIRDAEGDIPNESNTTEEWDAWKNAYKENPTGFIHSIYVVFVSETAPIPEINEADYVVKDGVLTSYVGTSIVVNIPDTVKEIAANAFANSPVAGSIIEINIGANVEEISTEAFENLPNLKRVNVADANPKYRQINIFNGSNGDGSSYSAHWVWYKEGINAVIRAEKDFPLPMELNSIPTKSPDEVVIVLCDGAELKISFIETQYTEKYAAQLHSIKYGEQVLDFDDPLPLKGNFGVYSFNFAEGYVFKRSANHDEAYIFTKDGIITMLRGNARTNGVITLSCDETGNLIYHKENVEFASDRLQTADPFSNIITGPDYYFGEDGRVEIVNGELVFITEVTYTVEDFINSQGMTMEEWFERFALFNPGSLEELYQFNKENPYDWWKSRRVYYDTTVDFRLWGYNGEDTVLNLPTAIKSIDDNAFSNSPAADKITEINIGPNVEKISINAFAGLPSLVKVNIDPANPYFISGESEYGYGQYILSLNEPVAFYFSCKDDEPGKNTRNDELYIPCFEDNHITAAFKPYERFSLFWNDAIFEIEHHKELDAEFYNIYSVKYGNHIIDFSEKPINNAHYMVYTFKTELGFVLKFNHLRSSGYVFTANEILITPHVLFLYKNELGELCYYEEDDGYMDREQVIDPYSCRITSRDYPLTEEGVIKLVNGELVKEPQKILTISEYFISQGTTIDEWFEEVSINDFDSLEEMFEHNKNRE